MRLLLGLVLLLLSTSVFVESNPGTKNIGEEFSCGAANSKTFCVKGSFAMKTGVTGILIVTPQCKCFACPPGTYRDDLNVVECTACGDQKVCPSRSDPPMSPPPGTCSYFTYNPVELQRSLSDFNEFDGRIIFGSTRITAQSFYAPLATDWVGGMREARNQYTTCGSLHVSSPANPLFEPVVPLDITASPPNLVDSVFALTNPGSLPVTISVALPSFASVVDSNYVVLSPSNDNNRLLPGTTNYRLQIDTSRLSAPYLWANQSGANFEVRINSFQTWLTAPKSEPLTYLPLNKLDVRVQLSTDIAVLVTPTLIDFGTGDASTVSTRVLQLYNMFPGQISWTSQVVYGDAGNTLQWLSIENGDNLGGMNGSTTCLSNMLQSNPLSEYTDNIRVTANGTGLSAGLYQARILVRAQNVDTLVTARINVVPGVANFALTQSSLGAGISRATEATIDITQSMDLLLSSVDDYGSLTTQSFPNGKDGSEFAFNVTWYLRDDPNKLSKGSVRANYESNGIWRARPFVGEIGLYNFTIHEISTGIMISSAQDLSLEVLPINCASYSVTSVNLPDGSCGCLEGYGVASREGAFYVACEPCPSGTKSIGPSSTSSCTPCNPGTFNSDIAKTECSVCPMNEGFSIVEMKQNDYVLRPLRIGSAVDIETDTFTMESSLDHSKCETCAKDSYLDPSAKICLPCPSDKKPRRIVKSISALPDGAVVEKNDTSLIPTHRFNVSWVVECVCRYNTYTDGNACVPCPPGAYCAFRTSDALLPLYGYWQEPFNSEAFTPCRQASSCPGVSLNSAKGILDDYLIQQELIYLHQVNQSLHQALSTFASPHLSNCPPQAFNCDLGYSGPLCYKCTASFTRDGLNGCQECIESSVLTFVIILGIVIALSITIWIVRKAYIAARDQAFDQNDPNAQGRELQMLKLIVSYLQEMSMSSSYVLSWPSWVLSVFQIFNVISSAGQSLFSVGCLIEPSYTFCPPTIENVTSNVETVGLFDVHRATTFFYEALFLACIPIAWGIIAGTFWIYVYTRERTATGKRRGKSTINYFILSIICLLFILYPSLSLSALKFFSCSAEDLNGNGLRFLEADANVVCFGLTHLKWMATLGIVMLVLYALGTPLTLFYVLYYHHSAAALAKYRSTFGFVFTGYKPKYYFWECVIMARKLAFSCVAVLMAPVGADLQAYTGLFVIVVFLQLQTALQPYEDPVLNTAETMGLQARFLTLLLGIMLDSSHSGVTFVVLCGSFIIVINIMFLLFALRILFKATAAASREVGLVKAIGLDRALSWLPRSGSQSNFSSSRRMDGGGSFSTSIKNNGKLVDELEEDENGDQDHEGNFEYVSPIVAQEMKQIKITPKVQDESTPPSPSQ